MIELCLMLMLVIASICSYMDTKRIDNHQEHIDKLYGWIQQLEKQVHELKNKERL